MVINSASASLIVAQITVIGATINEAEAELIITVNPEARGRRINEPMMTTPS